VYTASSADDSSLGVKPVDDTKASQCQNSDHAGTLENYKPYVTGGARGSGRSNWTGSYTSGTSVSPCTATSALQGATLTKNRLRMSQRLLAPLARVQPTGEVAAAAQVGMGAGPLAAPAQLPTGEARGTEQRQVDAVNAVGVRQVGARGDGAPACLAVRVVERAIDAAVRLRREAQQMPRVRAGQGACLSHRRGREEGMHAHDLEDGSGPRRDSQGEEQGAVIRAATDPVPQDPCPRCQARDARADTGWGQGRARRWAGWQRAQRGQGDRERVGCAV
jgi:hypothetical protein